MFTFPVTHYSFNDFSVSDNRKCIGNSGSSYISQKREVSTLQGIVSLSVELQNKECNDNSIVVITDVSRYLRWIRHHLKAAAA